MKNKFIQKSKHVPQTATGFSLIEVMFSVLVLTMGMVFVASMFPLGLVNSRRVAEQTISDVDTHNVMARLKREFAKVSTSRAMETGRKYTEIDGAGQETTPPHARTYIHPLIKPNVLADSQQVVLDDPENLGYFLRDYRDDGTIKKDAEIPDWLFWSDARSRVTLPPEYPDFSDIFYGDIGHFMCPPVDATDQEVLKKLRAEGYGYRPDQTNANFNDYLYKLNRAILEVSKDRNFCWSAIYDRGTKLVYIFTMRYPQTNNRYAVQSDLSFYPNYIYDINPIKNWPERPEAGPENLDRILPVPWRVFLNPYHPDLPNGTLVVIYGPKKHFYVDAVTAEFLMPGSFIIDGDSDTHNIPVTRPTTYPQYLDRSRGNCYEILDVQIDPATANAPYISRRYIVTTKEPITSDMSCFWVFPPAILRDGKGGYEFSTVQPVIDVTIIKMDF
ncbi:MAG: hypothetical protein K9M57_03940 [Phycisphaerae bacterium]|nr:hypothetical protein [Phycisphaerae bacterium]